MKNIVKMEVTQKVKKVIELEAQYNKKGKDMREIFFKLMKARAELLQSELEWFESVDKEPLPVTMEDTLHEFDKSNSKKAFYVAIYECKRQYIDAHNDGDEILKNQLIQNFLTLKGCIEKDIMGA